MIISASRRTDIPSFYSSWFFNRIKEGYVLVSNPFNPKMLSRVELDPAVVDCIVFWTKNPAPMMDKLDLLKHYKYYFQFTVNPYGREIEHNLPGLSQRIDLFKRLSERIGKEKVIWRYDPVFINAKYNIAFHREAFAQIAEKLQNYTEKCMLGFIDSYPHIRKVMRKNEIKPLLQEEMEEMAVSFKTTAERYPTLKINTCTVKVDLRHWGIPSGQCIDKELVERITGYSIIAGKDKNQRGVCNCIESIDIGAYDSCLNGCLYCYAIKGNSPTVKTLVGKHNPHSPLMIGEINEGQTIKERKVKSFRNDQLSLF